VDVGVGRIFDTDAYFHSVNNFYVETEFQKYVFTALKLASEWLSF